MQAASAWAQLNFEQVRTGRQEFKSSRLSHLECYSIEGWSMSLPSRQRAGVRQQRPAVFFCFSVVPSLESPPTPKLASPTVLGEVAPTEAQSMEASASRPVRLAGQLSHQ